MGDCINCGDTTLSECHGCGSFACSDCKNSLSECPNCGQSGDWG